MVTQNRQQRAIADSSSIHSHGWREKDGEHGEDDTKRDRVMHTDVKIEF